MIKYIKFSLIISSGLFFGRLLGFIREIIIANKFGISELTDKIILILTGPDLINNIVSVSAISLILIPYFEENKNRFDIKYIMKKLVYKFFILSLISYLVTSLIFVFIYENDILILLLISLISIFPNILSGIFVSWLQFKEKFFLPSFTTFIFNFFIVISLLFYIDLRIFSIAVVIASFFRFIFIYFPSFNNFKSELNKKKFYLNKSLENLSYKKILIIFLSYGLIYTIPVIDKIFASKLQDGELSLISFAEKVYSLPCLILLSTFSIAIFPKFTKLTVEKKFNELKILFNKSLFVIFVGSITVLLVIIVFGEHIIGLIYYFSDFNEITIKTIYDILINFSGVILFYGFLSLIISIMFSSKLINEIFIISLFGISIKILLNSMVILNNGTSMDLALNSSIVFSIISFLLYLTFTIKLNKKISNN